MMFDRSHETGTTSVQAQRAFYLRRAKHLNVQFIRENGSLDEWSFAAVAQRDSFIASLSAKNQSFAVSS